MGELRNNIQDPSSVMRPDELIEKTTQAAIRPLRRGFEDNIERTTEQLSTRGIQFGDLATEKFGDVLRNQSELEADVATRVGSQLGLSAQAQAFQANQAAEERGLRKELQKSGQEFSTGERIGSQEFAKGNQLLQLALSGNLKGSGIGEAIKAQFGDNISLTTEDDADLQRVSQASGLSPEEFTQMRQLIGQGQLDQVIENPEAFIFDPERAREFQVQLAEIAAGKAQGGGGGGGGGGLFSTLGSIVGAAGGFITGGPAGAAAGAQAGKSIGGAIDG